MKTIMKKSLLLILLLTVFFQLSYSQTHRPKADLQNQHVVRCHTDELMQQKMLNPLFAAKYNELKKRVSQEMKSSSQAPCANPLVVPVVIHFESGSISNQCMIDASIAQIDQMNADFASCNSNAGIFCDWINAGCDNFGGTAGADAMPDDGACIQFCLADQNLPTGETTIGGYAITAGDYSSNSQNASNNWQGYFNVYVGAAGGNLGFVPFLGGANNANNTQGASVLTSTFGADGFTGCEGVGTDTQFGNGATLTHEAGHCFGLSHTFSDNVADTPPQSNPNFGCPTVNLGTCTSSVGSDYGGNFMDYVDDDCMFIFTQDQVDIMIATADAQANWETNSISCTVTYPPCANQAGPCSVVCPTAVTTPINITSDFCGASDINSFPDVVSAGLVLDDNSDATYSWSIGGYLSAGGSVVTAPTIQTSTACTIVTETYYLNIDCGSTPLSPTLNGGTMIITAYPAPPADISTLVTVTGENTCDEPLVSAIPGCETYVSIVANGANPNFPVGSGVSGTASYTVTFVSNPAGPECCVSGCEVTVTGDYNCIDVGCIDCKDEACTTTIACDDNDCATSSDMVTVLISDNNIICVPCAGIPVNPPSSQVIIDMTTDNNASEIAWTISDLNNNIMINSPMYSNTSSQIDYYCLDDGCYEFAITDASGDGICCLDGNGFYTFKIGGINTIPIRIGSSYGAGESFGFCLDSNLQDYCAYDLNDSGIIASSYSVKNTIVSDGVVPAVDVSNMPMNIFYDASMIDLLPGFEVKLGAEFSAEIDPCEIPITTTIVTPTTTKDQ